MKGDTQEKQKQKQNLYYWYVFLQERTIFKDKKEVCPCWFEMKIIGNKLIAEFTLVHLWDGVVYK